MLLAADVLKSNPGLVARAVGSLEKAETAAEADTIWDGFLTAIAELTHAGAVCSSMP